MSDCLIIIPARGGSKRLPGKNILPLAGKPLIAWTIEAALHCGIGAEICVSTDDEKIASVARKYGASVPFLRPPSLSGDSATSLSVAFHALDFYQESEKRTFDTCVFLQPTSPLRDATHIAEAFALFEARNANNVVSVCPVEHSPLWTNTLPADGSMEGFLRPDVRNCRSQDLPQYYRLNGSIYICKVTEMRRQQSLIMDEGSYAYIMDQEYSIDIDTMLDFKIAEVIISPAGGNKGALLI
jgi:CMP-N-acetylneuraminic acid synthetase